MTCVKTGCHVYIIPSGTFARGDAFEFDGTYIFRIVVEDNRPFQNELHFEINNYAMEWRNNIITLVARGDDVISYGYEGRSILEFDYINAILQKEQN